MSEVSFQAPAAFEVDLAALGSVVIRSGFATAWQFAVAEVPQPSACPVAILNLTGWCSFTGPDPAGVCVMVVGRGVEGDLLWAAALRATPRENKPTLMLESLLIAPESVGRTRRVALRMCGGRFTPPEPFATQANDLVQLPAGHCPGGVPVDQDERGVEPAAPNPAT